MKLSVAVLIGCVLVAVLTHEAFAQSACKTAISNAKTCISNAANANADNVGDTLDTCASQAKEALKNVGECGAGAMKAIQGVVGKASSAWKKAGKAVKGLGNKFADLVKGGLDSLKD